MMLRAGAAVRDISPKGPAFLAGYPHVERISTGVHDPLLASALCLKNESTGVVLVAVDILLLDPPTARELRAAVAARTALPEAGVFISCTHTHSGPLTGRMLAWRDDPVVPEPDPGYLEGLKRGVLEAAEEACRRAAPAELAWTSVPVRSVGGNRLSPEGMTDPEAGALAVRGAADRRPLALALIYGMHPTVLHEDSQLVSADFPAYARAELRESLGGELVVLYHNGPCGNQSPRHAVEAQTFAEAERLGRSLGRQVAAGVAALADSDYGRAPGLGGAIRRVELPPRRMPSVAEAERALAARRAAWEALQRANAGRGAVRTAECAVFGAEETLSLARAQASGELAALVGAYRSAEVQAVAIGAAGLAGFPGELFTEYGLELKRRSPRKAFPVSLVNGELQGYVVTPEAAAAGGYEAANSLFAPESGYLMVEALLEMMCSWR
jgi:hypothetical protein